MSAATYYTAEILAWFASEERYLILEGESEIVAPQIPDCSVDAVVSDPPAGIAFMGKQWDDDKGGKEHWIAWLAGILREAFRVLKPGGHMFLWALPRTSHWTAEAIERAGFEIRDVVPHHFGSGFPKSLDVSKAIDSAKGAERKVVGPVASPAGNRDGTNALGGGWQDAPMVTAPATSEARQWFGWGTALKPASEFWIMARKPLSGTVASNVLAHGTGAINIDAARVGAGIARPGREGLAIGFGARGASRAIEDTTTGRWPANLVLSHAAWEETHCPCGAVCSFVARFCPECGSGEVTHHRCGCRAVGERRVQGTNISTDRGSAFGIINDDGWVARERKGQTYTDPDGLETVTAWECLATCACGLSTLAPSGGAPPRCRCGRAMVWACPVARLDEQSSSAGMRSAGGARESVPTNSTPGYGGGWGNVGAWRVGDTDQGSSASRFFNTFAPPDDTEPFYYCAKPSAAETEAGCERLPARKAHEVTQREEGSAGSKHARSGATHKGRRNHHPTKKGIDLMRHFCRLACRKGGVILDLFAGSCTTVCAGALEEQRVIAIEMDPEFVAIGKARAAFWAPLAGTQVAARETPTPKREEADARQVTIFDLLGGTR